MAYLDDVWLVASDDDFEATCVHLQDWNCATFSKNCDLTSIWAHTAARDLLINLDFW